MSEEWKKAQEWEGKWHNKCLNTYYEETKQLVYAQKMGLKMDYSIDVNNKKILDIGGGEVSLLLKTRNLHEGVVVDPLSYPEWVTARYNCAGIRQLKIPGEDILEYLSDEVFDECWIYNCLQHVQNPKLIIENAKKIAKVIRIFEWIDKPTDIGHLHTLTENEMNQWLGSEGGVDYLDEFGCKGRAYFGVFNTNL